MPLSDFLTVSISLSSVSPSQQNFGVPLILGACQNALTAFGASLKRTYNTLAGMVSDGFLTTDPEYLAAQAVFSQDPAPPTVIVGLRTNLPTQKFQITILGAPVQGQVYTVNVNGVAKSYTAGASPTTSTVATGLATAIGAPTGFGAASASSAVVTVTASAAGTWARFQAVNPDVDMDIYQTNIDGGIATDLQNIFNVDGGADWYTITSTFGSALELAAAAAWTEANGKILLADSQDSTILSSGTGDIATTLKTSAAVRSPVYYHSDNGAFLGAAVAGTRLTFDPGSETWKFAQPAGVAADVLTASQITNLKAKRANWLYSVGGVNITGAGLTPSGQYIDTVRFRDWQAADMGNAIFNALLNPPQSGNPANPGKSASRLGKIPFDDNGIAIVENEIRASLDRGVAAGGIVPGSVSVTVPLAANIPSGEKAARAFNRATWTAELAGAIENASISGGLTL